MALADKTDAELALDIRLLTIQRNAISSADFFGSVLLNMQLLDLYIAQTARENAELVRRQSAKAAADFQSPPPPTSPQDTTDAPNPY